MRRFILSLLLSCLLVPSWAEAARLFTCGLEESVLTTAVWTVASGSPAASLTYAHSGTYSLRINQAGSGMYLERNLATGIASGSTMYSRFYLFFETIPGATTSVVGILSNLGGSTAILQILSSGKLRLVNAAAGNTTFDSTATITADTWYRVESRHLVSDTTGQIEFRLYEGDSTTALDTWGDGNFAGGDGSDADTLVNTSVGVVRFGSSVGNTVDVYFDDIAMNDTSGTFQTSWVGPGKIAMVVPNGDTSVAWTKAGSAPAATNYQGVDGMPGTPDDGTTYNVESGNANEDKLALTSLPAEVPSSATLTLMDVYGRVSASGASGTMKLKVWNHNDIGTEGPVITVTTTTWKILTTNEHQVYDLTSGYTKSNLDSFSAGYIATGGSPIEKRITSLWGNVEWIEAPAASGNFFNRRRQQ